MFAWLGRSIRGILIYSLIFLIVIPGSLLGFVVLNKIETNLQNEIFVTNLTLARSLATQIDEILSRAEKIVIITGDIARKELAGGRNLDAVLSSFVKTFPAFSRLQVLDNQGIVRHSSNRRDLRIGYDFSRHSTDITALSQSESNWSLTHIPLKGKTPSIAISRGFNGFAVVGYLDLAEMSRNVSTLAAEAGVRSLVLDHKAFLVASSEPEMAVQRANFFHLPYVEQGLTGRFESGRGKDEHGVDVIVSAAGIKAAELMAVVFRGANGALAPVTYVRRMLLISMGLVCLAAIFVIFYVYRRIQSPLAALSEYTDKVADGQYDLLAGVRSLEEFDHLKNNFLRMTQAISTREKDLKKARKIAEAAARARSVFLANMSHELRTPLNAVIGLTDLALRTDLTSKQYDYISKTSSAAKRLLGIINDILDFSKIEASKLEMESAEFSLEQVLDSVTDIIGMQAHQKGLELIYDIDPVISRKFKGDSLRLGQVLINLGTNAVKFTENGVIVIGVRKSDTSGPEKSCETELQFFIRDTGIGLTPEQINNLFIPFHQADSSTTRKYGGTGLGLSICKKLVSMMKGRIWVESESGRGSTFFFTVTLGSSGATDSYVDERVVTELRVLIVDDNKIARRVLREYLLAWSFQVLEADCVRDAEKIIKNRQEKNRVDLVLMDWNMPGMDGIEGTRRLKNNPNISPTPSVLMITAYGRDEIRNQARKAGVDSFLLKPVNPSLLFETIMEVLEIQIQRPVFHGKREIDDPERLRSIQGAHVLLVEDNALNQQVAMELLEHAGVVVSVAENGFKALQMTEENTYDLVLMDIQMPEMDGYEATRRIRRREVDRGLKRTPVSAMTAHALGKERARCFDAGMDDYITKPIDLEKLYAVLLQLIPPGQREPIPGETHLPGQESPIILPDELPGVDLGQALRLLNGNRRFFISLLHQFVNEFENSPAEITQALEQGNNQRAHTLSHTAKGLAGSLGASRLYAIAHRMEETAQKGLSTEALALMGEYKMALTEVIKAASLCSHPGSAREPSALSAPSLDENAILRQLKTMVDKFEMDSLTFFLDHKNILAILIPQERMDELEPLLQNYDLEQAAELLQAFLGGETHENK